MHRRKHAETLRGAVRSRQNAHHSKYGKRLQTRRSTRSISTVYGKQSRNGLNDCGVVLYGSRGVSISNRRPPPARRMNTKPYSISASACQPLLASRSIAAAMAPDKSAAASRRWALEQGPLQVPHDHVARPAGGVEGRESVAAHAADCRETRRGRLSSSGDPRPLYVARPIDENPPRILIFCGVRSSIKTSRSDEP
jgi:hypothetical protein